MKVPLLPAQAVQNIPKGPVLGLVCISSSRELRYCTITRTRLLSFKPARREKELTDLYGRNLQRLDWVLTYCRKLGVRLYRVTSNLFPMSDEPIGRYVLTGMAAMLSAIGRRAERLHIRVTAHPDLFVVLNSESPEVVRNSIQIMEKHALAFDLLGLPRSPWAALTLHGGKSGRGEDLIHIIGQLPEAVRSRLVMENDEYAYGALEILEICRAARIPMVFDAHHHLVREKLESYEHPSIAQYTRLARETWPNPAWQIVHISNGRQFLHDPDHADRIHTMPGAFRKPLWIEVEAKGKENAIADLVANWLVKKNQPAK